MCKKSRKLFSNFSVLKQKKQLLLWHQKPNTERKHVQICSHVEFHLLSIHVLSIYDYTKSTHKNNLITYYLKPCLLTGKHLRTVPVAQARAPSKTEIRKPFLFSKKTNNGKPGMVAIVTQFANNSMSSASQKYCGVFEVIFFKIKQGLLFSFDLWPVFEAKAAEPSYCRKVYCFEPQLFRIAIFPAFIGNAVFLQQYKAKCKLEQENPLVYCTSQELPNSKRISTRSQWRSTEGALVAREPDRTFWGREGVDWKPIF